jgi:hypothetical protein
MKKISCDWMQQKNWQRFGTTSTLQPLKTSWKIFQKKARKNRDIFLTRGFIASRFDHSFNQFNFFLMQFFFIVTMLAANSVLQKDITENFGYFDERTAKYQQSVECHIPDRDHSGASSSEHSRSFEG